MMQTLTIIQGIFRWLQSVFNKHIRALRHKIEALQRQQRQTSSEQLAAAAV